MRLIGNVARFWYDFIVGDDWTIALAVVVTLVVVALLTQAHVAVWWLLPLVVLAFLGWSLYRVAHKR
jgi:hypothetical protein